MPQPKVFYLVLRSKCTGIHVISLDDDFRRLVFYLYEQWLLMLSTQAWLLAVTRLPYFIIASLNFAMNLSNSPTSFCPSMLNCKKIDIYRRGLIQRKAHAFWVHRWANSRSLHTMYRTKLTNRVVAFAGIEDEFHQWFPFIDQHHPRGIDYFTFDR